MKINRLFPLIFIATLVVASFSSVFAQSKSTNQPIWLPATSENQKPSSPQSIVNSINDHTMDVTITFSGIWAEIQTGNGQSYTRLWLDEYSTYREPGYPALPGTTFNILVPTGAQVDVIQKLASNHSLNLAQQGLPTRIVPAQRQVSKSEPTPDWTPPDAVQYASHTLSPSSWYEVNDTFQMRDYTILPIWINPVRYKAASGEIELLEEIKLQLTWPEIPVNFLKATNHDSPSFERLVSEIVINPPDPSTQTTTKTSEGYLIITPDEFESALTDFASMKEDQGYSVDVTLLSEISGFGDPLNEEDDNIQAIQTYIKSLDPLPVYLLIVGDTNFIPAPTGYVTNLKTDLYYGTLGDETDFTPDIHIGRLPARSIAEVTNMIDKLVNYSTKQFRDWHSDISYISTCDLTYDDLVIESHNYVISNYTGPLDFHGDFPNPDMIGGDQLFCSVENNITEGIETEIIARLNIGRGIITYSGHGAPNAWSDNVISIYREDISNISENNVYSFVSSFACSTNNFGSETNLVGFGETWMIQANKGAIGFIGSADLSYWGQDDILERSFYDSLFENPLDPTPVRLALSAGLSKVQELFPPEYYPSSDDGEGQYYWETYNLLGDPSQQLWLLPEFQYDAIATTQEKDGLMNSTIRYPIDITNLGNTDSYTASLEENVWQTGIDELSNLPYQSTDTLWVNVSIPMDAIVGATDTVSVTVSSIADPTLTTSFSFTTTAIETFFTRLPIIMK